MIGYYRTPAKTPVGGAFKNKNIRDRVDSEGQFGKWKLRICGTCRKVITFCIFSRTAIASKDQLVEILLSSISLADVYFLHFEVYGKSSAPSSLARTNLANTLAMLINLAISKASIQ